MKRRIENILDELMKLSEDPLFQRMDILDMTISVDNPEIHDDSEEASRSITISEFVQEVKGILIQKELI